jgi:hypothetical protein
MIASPLVSAGVESGSRVLYSGQGKQRAMDRAELLGPYQRKVTR